MTPATVRLKHNAGPVEMFEMRSTGRTVGHRSAKVLTHEFEREGAASSYQLAQPESDPSTYDTHRWGRNRIKTLEWCAESRASVAASNSLTSRDYLVTLDRVRSLNEEEDEADRPSAYAYRRTLELLRDVANKIGMWFPVAIAVTGPTQSIRLLWVRGDRELRVTVGGSATNKSYIYWLVPGESGISHTLDGQTLHQYMNWLMQVL
jgi:hypothetical protein